MRVGKLSPNQWRFIKNRLLAGEAANALAKEFGINESTIRLRAKREDWTNTPDTAEAQTLIESVKNLAVSIYGPREKAVDLNKLEQEIAELKRNQLPIIHRRMLLFSKMTDEALNVAIENIQELRKIDYIPTRIASTNLAVRTVVDLMKMVGYQAVPHEAQEYLPSENTGGITVNLVRKEIKTDT